MDNYTERMRKVASLREIVRKSVNTINLSPNYSFKIHDKQDGTLEIYAESELIARLTFDLIPTMQFKSEYYPLVKHDLLKGGFYLIN